MDSQLIVWDSRPREIAADPAATLALDRTSLEAAGASFGSYVDELGGSTAIATGLAGADDEPVAFAILDQGGNTGYLLVDGSYREHGASVDVVLDALIAERTIERQDVLERLPVGDAEEMPVPTARELDRKLGVLADEVASLRHRLAQLPEPAASQALLERRRELLGPTRRRTREEAVPHRSLVLAHALRGAHRRLTGDVSDLEDDVRLVRSALTSATPGAARRDPRRETDETARETEGAERPAPDPGVDFDAQATRFLEIAVTALAGYWTSRLQRLPAAVGDRAYDDALEAILRRARGGNVEAFHDESGRVSMRMVDAYVKSELDRKTQGAWLKPDVLQFTGGMDPALPAAEPTVIERLDRDAEADAMLEQARDELARFEERVQGTDARRLERVAELIQAHGITGPAAAVVMARATRRLQLQITAEGIQWQYEPPAGFRAIAESVGVSADTARQAYARAIAKLPAESRQLIIEPELHDGPDGPEPTD